MPFWVKVVEVLSGWLGSAIPLTPELCLLGDKSQIPNISKGAFSVIMVGLITASRIILRHWKTVERPDMTEWVDAVVGSAFYESMLNRLKGKLEDGTTSWGCFWTHIKTEEGPCFN